MHAKFEVCILAVPEILGGHKIWKVGHVTRTTPFLATISFVGLVSLTFNQHAKFEVCTFTLSRDIRGSQNLNSRSRDLCHAPFWPIFHFFGLVSVTINLHVKVEVIFTSSAVLEILGVQKLKSVSRDLGHAPFCTIYHFIDLVSLTFNPHAKFEVCIFRQSRDITVSQNVKSKSRDHFLYFHERP